MKKIISAALALGIALTLTGTVFARAADDAEGLEVPDTAGTTEISYDLDGDNTYTITIPATVDIEEVDEENALTVAVDDVKVLTGHTLNIYVTSANNFSLVHEEDIQDGYTDLNMGGDEEELVPHISKVVSFIPYDVTLGLAADATDEDDLIWISKHNDEIVENVVVQASQSMLGLDEGTPVGLVDDDLFTEYGACIMTVNGEGWLVDGVGGTTTLGITATTDAVNQATLGGEHTDTLTFTVSVDQAARDTEMATEMVSYSNNNILS